MKMVLYSITYIEFLQAQYICNQRWVKKNMLWLVDKNRSLKTFERTPTTYNNNNLILEYLFFISIPFH